MSLSDFNMSWFTTVPGLLITGGVVLLIFALFLLIATGKKSKKEKKAQAEAEALNQQIGGMAFPGQQVAADMVNVAQPVMTTPDVNANAGITPVPNTGAAPAPMAMTDPTMVNAMPVQPLADPVQVSAVPVAPDAMYSAVPTAQPTMVQPAAVTPAPVQPQAAPTIYGGANPAAVTPAPTPAYGGVDPAATVPVTPVPNPTAPVAPVAPVSPVPGGVAPVGTIPNQQ